MYPGKGLGYHDPRIKKIRLKKGVFKVFAHFIKKFKKIIIK